MSILLLTIKITLFTLVTTVGIICLWISIKPFFVENLPKDTREEISRAILSGIATGIFILAIILDVGIYFWEKSDMIRSLVGLTPVILCITMLTVVFSSITAFIRFQHIKALRKGVDYLIERNMHKDK